MPPKRRRQEAIGLPVALTRRSGREEVLEWLETGTQQGGCGLSSAAVTRLAERWSDDGEPLSGGVLLDADELGLKRIGLSAADARKVVARLRELHGPATQDLAPSTQRQQGVGNGAAGDEAPLRPPATQLTATQPSQAQPGSQATQAPQAPPQHIKPDPEEAAAEAAAWEEQQQVRRTRRRLTQQKQEPVSEAEEEDEEHENEDAAMEQAASEEEEETEEEEEEAPARARGRRVKLEQREEPANGAAVQEHSRPVTGRRGARTPGSQQREQEAEEVAGPSSGARQGTRRQQRQQVEEQQLRSTRRDMRARTMEERERRQEQDQDSEEEDEGEEPQQFAKDWQRRAEWGMREVFASMTLQQLRELVEEQEEWSELAANILRVKKNVDGERIWVDLEKPKQIAPRLVNFIMTGSPEGKPTDDGGMNKLAIKQLLRDYCDDACKAFVDGVLKLRYQNVPTTTNHHKLMWKLWHFPQGPNDDVSQTLLGRRDFEYNTIVNGADLEPNPQTGVTPWPKVWSALRSGRLTLNLEDEMDETWLLQLNDLSAHPRVKVSAQLVRDPGNKRLRLHLYQLFHKDSLSASLISGTFVRKAADSEEEEMAAVDLQFLFGGLDGFQGSPFMEAMDRLTQEFQDSCEEVTARGVDSELELGTPMSLMQFDRVMACVENIDRGEPQGFKDECNEALLLTLRPYQRRSLAHMLREERAQGGSSRHLWVKLNLPETPDIQCYVSPILHQIRSSTSRIEAEQWINANGGAGWIALQMGMGKTACAVGAIQMNPPPEGWRKNRAYQSFRARDHLSSITNNSPHGGTLIVMPATLIDQWEQEIRKTTDHDLTILKWTETSKANPRTVDCKYIASFDVVLTTFQNASNLHTLSHIYWWRIIADEPQLNAGAFLADREHTWFAQHRWLLTGTPINATVDSMGPSLEFLKLGTFDALYKHYPPVIAHVLKRFMVRFTKLGMLDGETNLELPAIQEQDVECELSAVDKDFYRTLQVEQKQAFFSILNKCNVDPDYVGDEDPNWEERRGRVGKQMLKIRGMVTKLRQAATSALKQPTGEEHYDDEKGAWVKERHWYQSKAEAVIEVLQDKDPEEKVLVFSEFPDTLRAIKELLPTIDLQSRHLLGSSSAAARGKAIREFQTDPPTKVFLLTYRAGGAGITLTAGTHIILCEPTLNPSFERQAIGRSHRMGQDKALTVTRLLMRGTIEEKIKAFVKRQVEQVQADPEEQVQATALEANLAANDETNKLTIEELRDFIYRVN